MNVTIFNRCLIVAWLLLTAGACSISVAAGLATCGGVLLALTLYVGDKFGVYQQPQKTETEAVE